eukprot:1249194-Rhodomonas_salina.2
MAEFVKHLKNTGFNVDLFKPETCIFEQFMLEREEGLFIPPWVHLPQATAAVVEEIDDTDRASPNIPAPRCAWCLCCAPQLRFRPRHWESH